VSVLRAENLSFSYRDGPAVLHDVSVSCGAGCVTAVIGPNASGKTTLLRLLLGVLRPGGGRVLYDDGEDVISMSASRRAGCLAYVAQRPTVDAMYTVETVVGFGRYRGGVSASAVREAMEMCEVFDLADRMYQSLSVGQQQRVSLARALAQLDGGGEGQVVLLDEPMSAMDPRHTAMTARILRTLAAGGTSVIAVLHDAAVVERVADEVWILDDGRLVASGVTASLLTPEMMERVFRVPFVRAGGLGGVLVSVLEGEGKR